MAKSKIGNYVVGRGKPPKHRQYPPGKSGNLKGRPKGRKNMRTRLREALNRMVTYRENGKEVEAALGDVIVKKTISDVISGNGTLRLKFIELILKHDDPAPEAANDNESDQLPPDDEAILAVYEHRIREMQE